MAKLVVHTLSGEIITAPFETWVVALINSLPPAIQQDVFARVSRMEGASLIPDKFLMKEDEIGTIHMIEMPVIDIGGKV